jgi:hypothetical protein
VKFPLIDWNEYDKPPFFPEWLKRGETLEQVRYDDNMRVELNQEIIKGAEQFDIDRKTGPELDRIGNLVGEYRNGKEDDLYRVYIKWRIVVNHSGGTINDIITAIQFLYHIEVPIEPDYPAGLKVKHDGWRENDFYFREIIYSVIPAGVGTTIVEVFNILEELLADELFKKLTAAHYLYDILPLSAERISMPNGILRLQDQAILEDSDSPKRYNGTHRYNGGHYFDARSAWWHDKWGYQRMLDEAPPLQDEWRSGYHLTHIDFWGAVYNGDLSYSGKEKYRALPQDEMSITVLCGNEIISVEEL